MEKFKRILRTAVTRQARVLQLTESQVPVLKLEDEDALVEDFGPVQPAWLTQKFQLLFNNELVQMASGQPTKGSLNIPNVGKVLLIGVYSSPKTLKLYLPPEGHAIFEQDWVGDSPQQGVDSSTHSGNTVPLPDEAHLPDASHDLPVEPPPIPVPLTTQQDEPSEGEQAPAESPVETVFQAPRLSFPTPEPIAQDDRISLGSNDNNHQNLGLSSDLGQSIPADSEVPPVPAPLDNGVDTPPPPPVDSLVQPDAFDSEPAESSDDFSFEGFSPDTPISEHLPEPPSAFKIEDPDLADRAEDVVAGMGFIDDEEPSTQQAAVAAIANLDNVELPTFDHVEAEPVSPISVEPPSFSDDVDIPKANHVPTDQAPDSAPAAIRTRPPSRKIAFGAAVPGQTIHRPESGLPIDELLRNMVIKGSSDLHLSPDQPAIFRIDGDVQKIDQSRLSPEKMEQLLLPIMPEFNRTEFYETSDTDFAYEIPDLGRFRVNVFRNRLGVGAVLRHIPSEILTAEQLGLAPAIMEFCNLSKGMVLVTGPTGSGKSTTLAAMIDHINKNRAEHLLTIEDPVEFVHQSRKCLVNQRQIGAHSESFSRALKGALRQDPDIILIGEMRDLETTAIALETAETGHLVFGTLHTTTAVSTVDRIIDQFPTDQQEQVRLMVANSLKGVIAQTLLKKVGGGRIAAQEILVSDDAVANMIREGKNHFIFNHMQTQKASGNILLNDALMQLVIQKKVTPIEAWIKSIDKKSFAEACKRKNIAVNLPSEEMQAS